jgi:hypothetical protein
MSRAEMRLSAHGMRDSELDITKSPARTAAVQPE